MLDIDKCVFYSVLQKITRVFSPLLLFIKACFSYQQYHREGPKKMKIIGLNPNFSVCCLFFGDFFVFVAVIVMT